MSGRRQFQSCDFCRLQRKKCDAAALGIDPSSGDTQSRQSCSTCAKSSRTCTFNWLKEHKRKLALLSPRTPKNRGTRKASEQLPITKQENIASSSANSFQIHTNPVPAYPQHSSKSIPSLRSHPPISPSPFLGQLHGPSEWNYQPRERQHDGFMLQPWSNDPWLAPDWSALAEQSSAGRSALMHSGQIWTNFAVPNEATHKRALDIPTAGTDMFSTYPQSPTTPPLN